MFRIAVALLVLSLVGCGDSAAKVYRVSGEVTVDGAPVEQGNIAFDPADGVGSAYGADVVDGAFRLRCSPGTKIVSVRMYRLSAETGPDGKPIHRQVLPERYNLKSQLRVEVRGDGDNHFELALKSR